MLRPFCLLALSLLLCAVVVDSFWLSQNRLAWNDSQTYCQAQCGTDLATIHNASEWRAAQDLIDNETLITGGFTSAPYQGSQRVWVTNAECAYFPGNEDAAYETANCSSKYRFLCESCEGVLDKYILYSRQERGEHVDRECSANLNTTGASVHSDDDMASIASLCLAPDTNQVGNNGLRYYCWFGLQNKNNTGNLSTFAWTDGSFFDYGSDFPGTDPWAVGEPSYKSEFDADENCVQIRARVVRSDWIDKECSTEGHLICNKPNEFCYADRWSVDGGHFADCAFVASDDSMAVISNKKWTDRNWPLKIEYVFQANYTQSDSGQPSDIGVVVLYENRCNYLFIGLSLGHQTNEVLLKVDLVEHPGLPSLLQTEPVAHSLSSFDPSRFYHMDIEIRSSQDWSGLGVVITFDHTFSHDFFFSISSDEYVEDTWVGPRYIAVRNRNVAVTGKSLFISGTPDYSDAHSLTTCINKYTTAPTSNPSHATTAPTSSAPTLTPSASPTVEPTLEPTSSPTFYPTLSPTFEPMLEPSLVPSSSTTGSTGLGSKRVEGSSTTAVEDSASGDSDSPQSPSNNGPGVMIYVLLGIFGCVVCALVAGWYAMGKCKASASPILQIDHRLSFGKNKVRIIKPNHLQAESDAVELAPEPGRNVAIVSIDVGEEKQDDSDSSLYSVHDNRDRQAAGNTTKGVTSGGNNSEDSESSQSSDILRGEHGGHETSGNGINRANNVLLNQADGEQDSLDDN